MMAYKGKMENKIKELNEKQARGEIDAKKKRELVQGYHYYLTQILGYQGSLLELNK